MVIVGFLCRGNSLWTVLISPNQRVTMGKCPLLWPFASREFMGFGVGGGSGSLQACSDLSV